MRDCKTIFTIDRLTADILRCMGVEGMAKFRLPDPKAVTAAQELTGKYAFALGRQYRTEHLEGNIIKIHRIS